MANRPDPRDLAQYSYILALTSDGLLLFAFLVLIIPGDSLDFLGQLVWLVFPSSGIGLALALMARADFKRQPPDKKWIDRMRTGLRINALALVLMLLFLIVAAIVPLVLGSV
jgi:hypothetical protein